MLKLKLQSFGHLMWRTDSFEKTLMRGKIEGQNEKGTTEDEMAGWHHRLKEHESESTPGVGDGQGGLACCSPWGLKESDTTEWLNQTETASEEYTRILKSFFSHSEGKSISRMCQQVVSPILLRLMKKAEQRRLSPLRCQQTDCDFKT